MGIGDTILADQDKVYIILKESMEKCHDSKEKEYTLKMTMI